MDFANLIKAGCIPDMFNLKLKGDVSSGNISQIITENIVIFPISFKFSLTTGVGGSGRTPILKITYRNHNIYKVACLSPQATSLLDEYYFAINSPNRTVSMAGVNSDLHNAMMPEMMLLRDTIISIGVDQAIVGDTVDRSSLYCLKFEGDISELKKQLNE